MYNLLTKYTGRLYEGEGLGGGTPPAPPSGGEHPVANAPWSGVTDTYKVGEAGKETEWWNAIPEEKAREHVKAKGYKNPAELALANYSLTKMQTGSTDVVGLPGKDATQNDWDAFFTKAGRPAAPGDYKFDAGEGVTMDPTMVEFGQKLFHKVGVLPQHANEGVKMWNEFVAAQNAKTIEANQQANADEMRALETSWGASLNENKAAGERVMRALGLDEAKMTKIEGAIGSAAIVELLASIGKKSAEGTLIGGSGGGDPNDPAGMTKDQATEKIKQLSSDAEFQKAYNDAKHPGHKDAVERMNKLYART